MSHADPDPPRRPVRYVALVPVKPPALGKSRLAAVPGLPRRELAGALALDTVSAVLTAEAVERVLVVTDDALFSRDLVALGCASMPDGDTSDLNATLEQAAAEARRRWPGLRPFALCADLPALRPTDLADALVTVARLAHDGVETCFVADSAGEGTTMFSASHGAFVPRFGPGSRGAHLAAGAREITGPLASLRCDVDDEAALRAALALGVGPHTSAALGAWRPRG